MARTKQGQCQRDNQEIAQQRARPKPISGDCQDGYGKAKTHHPRRTDQIYEGHFKDGQPHGEGSWTHSKDVTTTGTFERGSMVIGTVTINTDVKKYDDVIRSMEEEIAALKEELAVAVKRAEANRASDGASWTGTWANGTPSGEGVWRLRDGREACGACPENILGDDYSYSTRATVPLWVHETATAVAVPAPEAPQGDEGAAELPVLEAAGTATTSRPS